MPYKPNKKMSIPERAKQFMPFAALAGLPEALARVEKEVEEESVLKYCNEWYKPLNDDSITDDSTTDEQI